MSSVSDKCCFTSSAPARTATHSTSSTTLVPLWNRSCLQYVTNFLWIPTHPSDCLLLEQVCNCKATQNEDNIRDFSLSTRHLLNIRCPQFYPKRSRKGIFQQSKLIFSVCHVLSRILSISIRNFKNSIRS